VNTLIASVLLACGIYLVWLAMLMNTKNMISAFIFKMIPILFGIANILVGLKFFGII